MALELLESQPAVSAGRTPLLFVHGAWHGAWCWADHFLPFFASRGHPSYAVSLRGHGGSAGRGGLRFTSLDDYVADVAEAISRVPAPPVLVGHSMGGLVVQLALARGAAARAGVLIASVPPRGVLPLTLRLARRHPLIFAEANLTLRLWPFVRTPALVREGVLRSTATDEEARAVHGRLQEESYRAFLGMLLPGLDPRAVRVPMLVLGAEADALFTVEEVRETARAYGVEAQLVPEAAHDLMLDPAWEEAARRIASWLDGRGF